MFEDSLTQTLLALLTMATADDMEIHQMDVDNAYLNAPLQEEIYMSPPKQLMQRYPDKVFKLKKSLYGLKQAGYEWNKLLNSTLQDLGWKRAASDTCLYTRNPSKLEYLLVYVDDLLIITSGLKRMTIVKGEIAAKFRSKDLGEASYILGLRLTRDRPRLALSLDQTALITRILGTYDSKTNNFSRIPMEAKLSLAASKEQANPGDITRYQEIVGSLLRLSRFTRPDISTATNIVGRFASNPGPDHFAAVYRILGYLRYTIEDRFRIGGNTRGSCETQGIELFTDSDWAGCQDDRKSTSGFMIKWGNSTVSWSSRKQESVSLSLSLSTMEAEYIALAEGVKEAIFIQQIVCDMGFGKKCLLVHCDNQAAVETVKKPSQHSKAKHIDIRYHFVRDLYEKGLIRVSYINTRMNPADLFTKPLVRDAIGSAKRMIGITCSKDRGSVSEPLNIPEDR